MSTEPIFQSVFGEQWACLPDVLKKHYANRPYSDDLTVVEGVLDVSAARPIKYLSWLFRLLRSFPVENQAQVPTTVRFSSDRKTSCFYFNRIFHFSRDKPYHFDSRMIQRDHNEAVEIMPFGLTWRMRYLWENERVKLKHKGYALHLFGCFIPLPLAWMIGRGYAEETAIDSEQFYMKMAITHPWWGELYAYRGRFKIKALPI